jgi:hypothetical protein
MMRYEIFVPRFVPHIAVKAVVRPAECVANKTLVMIDDTHNLLWLQPTGGRGVLTFITSLKQR